MVRSVARDPGPRRPRIPPHPPATAGPAGPRPTGLVALGARAPCGAALTRSQAGASRGAGGAGGPAGPRSESAAGVAPSQRRASLRVSGGRRSESTAGVAACGLCFSRAGSAPCTGRAGSVRSGSRTRASGLPVRSRARHEEGPGCGVRRTPARACIVLPYPLPRPPPSPHATHTAQFCFRAVCQTCMGGGDGEQRGLEAAIQEKGSWPLT